jgi:hypothetical protein
MGAGEEFGGGRGGEGWGGGGERRCLVFLSGFVSKIIEFKGEGN